MRALKQFMMKKRGLLKSEATGSDIGIRQPAAAAAMAGAADLDEVSRDPSPKMQNMSPTSQAYESSEEPHRNPTPSMETATQE